MKLKWRKQFNVCLEQLANRTIVHSGFAGGIFLEAFEEELLADEAPPSCRNQPFCLYCAIPRHQEEAPE